MALQRQVVPLSRSMDADSGDKYINTSEGRVRERINMRINELDGNSLFNKKLKGNVLVDITLPTGTNKCIGWAPDYKTESLLWFIYNPDDGRYIDTTLAWGRAVELGYVGTVNNYSAALSEFDGSGGDNTYSDYLYQVSATLYTGTYAQWIEGLFGHSILRYFINTGVIQKVWFAQGALDFEDTFLDARVVDGRVYWVNGNRQPKSFNIEKAVNYTNNLSGDKYSSVDFPLEDIVFPMIKRPPQFAPDAYYTTVTEEAGLTVNFNNLRGKLFQFKYSFVYEDDQESAYSPFSKVALPTGELTVSGEWVDLFSTNNAIKVTINTGSSIVRKINVAARGSLDSNEGDFIMFKTVNKFSEDGSRLIGDNAIYEVFFLNNKSIRNINTEINNRYMDDVPLRASSIELLDGKYLGLSMPVKGYPKVTADMTLEHEWLTGVNYGASIINMEKSTNGEGAYGYTNWWVTFAATPELNSTYRVSITFGDNTTIVADFPVGSVAPTGWGVRESIYNNLISDSRVTTDNLKKRDDIFYQNALMIRVTTNAGSNDIKSFTATIESGSISSYKSFKKGQYHTVGIVYNDGFGRYNIVNNEATVFVPYHPYTPFVPTYEWLSRIKFTIRHRPPIYATSYSFVYQPKASYTYSIDVVGVEVIASGTNNVPQGHTFFKVNQALEFYRSTNSNVLISDYVWQKGDRCRAYYQQENSGMSFEINPFSMKYEQTPVTNPPTQIIVDGFIINGELSSLIDISGVKYIHLEIFRPNFETLGNIFYETGVNYEILNPGTESRSHSANDVYQSSDLSIPASGALDYGDVYMRQRIVPGFSPAVIEDPAYSDFYLSAATDIGRAVANITGAVEQKELYRVIRSENFLEDTEYNLLNVWLPQTEFFTVSQSYGPITNIKEVGDVLKVIQEHKETSVYIGKTQIKQADGTNLTVISDRVFNEGNKYDSLFGSKYPRSIAANGRSLYYFDETTGDFIRSSPNGQESISEFYNFKSYFKAKANELRVSANFTDVIVSVDSLYEEVLVTFINGNTSESVAFFEKEGEKGFIYKAQIKPASGVPDNFAWYGDKLFSFLSGKLWKHDIGTDTSFYGDRKPCSISFIVNAGAGDANKFSDIEMSSPNNVWDVRFDINAGTNYPVQKTILKPAIIRTKENRLYSGILRNILGRNNTEDISKLRNGSQMTGETMLVTISNNTSGDWLLKEVEVKFLTSK